MSIQPSSVSSEGPSAQRPALPKVASGQRLIIHAILLNILAGILGAAVGGEVVAALVGLVAIVALVVGLVGLVRLASGLGYSISWRVFLIVLMLIPLINIITLLVLNSRATKALRAGGYKVGLGGASRTE